MIINPFQPFIESQGFVLLDGAMGTYLEAKGLNLNSTLWSAKILEEKPSLIKNVHRDYLEAGAEIITTSGYQASMQGLTKFGFSEEQSINLIHKTIDLAFEARNELMMEDSQMTPYPLIAASIGPYGAFLANGSEYHGNYRVSFKEIMDYHRKNIKILAYTKTDLLAFETIPSLQEGEAIIEVLTEFPDLKAWISFSCQNGDLVSYGESFSKVVEKMEKSPNIMAIGINCTAPKYIESLLKLAHRKTEKILMAYPNKGNIYDSQTKSWTRANVDLNLRDLVKIWYQAGARIIGGCCGIHPPDIREIGQALKEIM